MTRTQTSFLPYQYGGEQLTLELVDCSLGGINVEPPTDAGHGLIDLSEMGEWEVGSLKIKVVTGAVSVSEFVPSTERPAPPIRIAASLVCDATLRRWTVETEFDATSGTGSFTIELKRADVRDLVTLTVYAIRADQQDEDASFAQDLAARILATHCWTIRIDPQKRRHGPGLTTRWEPFSTSRVSFRKQNSDLLFHLDTSGQEPVLYLNSEVDQDLISVLKDEAPRGRKAVLRNAMFAAISIPVWVSLIQAALDEVPAEGDMPEGWARDALRALAVEVSPDATAEAAMDALIKDLRDPNGGRNIHDRIPCIASRMTSFRDRAEALVREMTS